MHRDRVHQVMVALWENYKLGKVSSGLQLQVYAVDFPILSQPLLGEALRLRLGRRDKLGKANLKNSGMSVVSADASSNSPSPGNYRHDNLIVTASSLSSGEGSSDWTDASLEAESSTHATRHDIARAARDNTSTCASSMSRSSSSHSNMSNASILSLCSSSSFMSETEREGRTQSSLSDRSISPLMTTPTHTTPTTPRQIDAPDGDTGSCWKDKCRCLCLQYIQRIGSSTTFINFFLLVV